MRSSRSITFALVALALFAAACSRSDDRVEATVNGVEITRGDVIDRLEDTGRAAESDAAFLADDFDDALGELQASALFVDRSAVAASANDSIITVGDLVDSFADPDSEGSEFGIEDLSRADRAARLRNLLIVLAFEEAFVELGFMEQTGVGSPEDRGIAIDALMASPGFVGAAEEWFTTSATEQQVVTGTYCFSILVTNDEGRADEFAAALSNGDSIDLLLADVNSAEQGGDDCRILDAFPETISSALLALKDGETSDTIVVEPANGADAPTTYVFVRRNNITDQNRVFLLDAVNSVDIFVHPAIGEWDPDTLGIAYDSTEQ
jgi:hypothetical protein